jgi:hypothetical protein
VQVLPSAGNKEDSKCEWNYMDVHVYCVYSFQILNGIGSTFAAALRIHASQRLLKINDSEFIRVNFKPGKVKVVTKYKIKGCGRKRARERVRKKRGNAQREEKRREGTLPVGAGCEPFERIGQVGAIEPLVQKIETRVRSARVRGPLFFAFFAQAHAIIAILAALHGTRRF